jgi:hypothetical protein
VRPAARRADADDGAHRGAGHSIDADALLFEHLQHADMRQPTRTAAGEHEPYARTRLLRASDAKGEHQQQTEHASHAPF